MNRKLVGLAVAGLACTLATGSYGYPQAQASAQQSTKIQAEKKPGGASASGASSTQASAQAGQQSAQLDSNTTFEAVLSKPVDCKKNKKGDRVEARTKNDVKSDGQVVIPKGSKLLGHVTEAKARAKGENESQLGIVFDRAVTKDGREIPVNVAIQAVAASEAAVAMAQNSSMEPMAQTGAASRTAGSASSGGGGLVGGVTSTAGAAVGTAAGAAGSLGSTASGTLGATTGATGSAGGGLVGGSLTSNSSGVLGLNGLTMVSEASSVTSAGASTQSQQCLLSSTTQNVRLESGTRFLLRGTKPQAQ